MIHHNRSHFVAHIAAALGPKRPVQDLSAAKGLAYQLRKSRRLCGRQRPGIHSVLVVSGANSDQQK